MKTRVSDQVFKENYGINKFGCKNKWKRLKRMYMDSIRVRKKQRECVSSIPRLMGAQLFTAQPYMLLCNEIQCGMMDAV